MNRAGNRAVLEVTKMKMKATLITLTLAATLASVNAPVLAQSSQDAPPQKKGMLEKVFGGDSQAKQKKKGQQKNGATTPSSSSGAGGTERLEPDDQNTLPADTLEEAQANRRGQLSEEQAAVLPYYNNFMTTYRLGPEDVISIDVFNQPRYSKSGIVVPPNGRISYYLVPEGITVVGKTTEQIQEELTKKLDEYIIDPKITVSLDKAMSARYSVLGDVAQPGIRTMTRRLSVYEALAEAGGVLATGDKSRVVILRQQPDGRLLPMRVNIKDIERGRAREMAFLAPGDQVVVPGNKLKTVREVMNLLPILSFARIFTGGW
ncbi:MAG: polysaccharide biosynthesis/export protein [Blastocatellia bacterium]|nr:polysaccharide biosynthesis/export protein [Blastocatellia bacterium]